MSKNFKIIISPSKSFNNIERSENIINTIYFNETKKIFNTIKSFSPSEIKNKYNVSENITRSIIQNNADFNLKTYQAIYLYGGLVFKQLKLDMYDMNWLNKHLIIVDAMYGLIKPLDYISKYRLDFKTNIDFNLTHLWKPIINKELSKCKIYNLASKEFSSLIDANLIDVPLDSNIKQIKKARGIALHNLIITLSNKL